MKNRIVQELDDIEQSHGVKIIYACESGSRAWGFASKDSDYDVRFIYVHPVDWYLGIAEKKDVMLNEYLPAGKIRNFIDDLIESKANDAELTRIERSASIEDYMDEELRYLDSKIPKNPEKIPVEEFDSVFKDILVKVNKQHPPT